MIKLKFVKEDEKWTLGNWSTRIWILKVEWAIIVIIRNELWEIGLREYRFLIIINNNNNNNKKWTLGN